MTAYLYPGTSAATWGMLPGYKELIVWQKATELAVQVHDATANLGPGYYRFRGQAIDSAESVPANIAEGYSGSSLGNYIRHCNIARGSLGELGTHLHSAERWKLLDKQALTHIIALYSDSKYLLDRLLSALRQKQNAKTWDQSYELREPGPVYTVANENEVQIFHAEHPEFFMM